MTQTIKVILTFKTIWQFPNTSMTTVLSREMPLLLSRLPCRNVLVTAEYL